MMETGELQFSREEFDAACRAVASLAEWYQNEFVPALMDLWAQISKAVQWLGKQIVEVFTFVWESLIRYLRRGLWLWRLFERTPAPIQRHFPWKVSRWLARHWPERWLPRFQVEDKFEFMIVFLVAKSL